MAKQALSALASPYLPSCPPLFPPFTSPTARLNYLQLSSHTIAFHTSLRLYILFLPSGMPLSSPVCLETFSSFFLLRCRIFGVDFLEISKTNLLLCVPLSTPSIASTKPHSNLLVCGLASPLEGKTLSLKARTGFYCLFVSKSSVLVT